MLTLIIQAGGASSRMGQDKALLPFLDQPLIQRVLGRVVHLADEVLVTTNNPQAYEFLGLPLFADVIPGRGALGGLYTALSAASHPLAAVVACDMPFVSASLLAYQRSLLESQGFDAAIPLSEGGTEPFHAVYRRAACLPAIERAIQADKWRVDAWYAQARIKLLRAEETAPYDPDGLAYWNVNTPEEFSQAEELARQNG